MGTRQLNKLSARTVTILREPGLYSDGGNLYLQVTSSGSKTWIFRYRSPSTKKFRDMGLGPTHSVGLAAARDKAAAQRGLLLGDLDPIQVRGEERLKRANEATNAVSFSWCSAAYIASHRPGWRNEKHGDQWESTIKTYCFPVIGDLPVQGVDTGHVLKILEPIWSTKAETASRLRGRIENILDWARARGYRRGENPARWKGHLNQLLPTLSKKDRVIHFKAMPFSDVGGLVHDLRQLTGVVPRCLEFTILTIPRTNEALKARPEEFDLANAIWTVPASRMKAKKEFRRPLPLRAVEIVREMLALNEEFVFPGVQKSKPLSNMTMLHLLRRMDLDVTVHGFRSSFRDWAAELSNFSNEVCEMALAHTISDAAEAAYRRGDLFEKRRHLMQSWADFVACIPVRDAVIRLRSAA